MTAVCRSNGQPIRLSPETFPAALEPDIPGFGLNGPARRRAGLAERVAGAPSVLTPSCPMTFRHDDPTPFRLFAAALVHMHGARPDLVNAERNVAGRIVAVVSAVVPFFFFRWKGWL
ncbi:MAG: hypothetical protein KDJ87_11840 [Rhizobiaceae bacterium]|nr:hypothetical protein [Rhizobiaceae bacterium]